MRVPAIRSSAAGRVLLLPLSAYAKPLLELYRRREE